MFGERLSFFFACHSDFIEEVAKFRAARRLWATLMRDRFGVTNPKAQHLRFHVQTGGVTLTAQQPENNVVRVTVQALAAVLGGCQSLHTNSMDEALALPTEAAAKLALRTQQVIAHETGVADMVDPLGGSFAVEAATDDIEAEAVRLLNGIEARGGALAAIERGEIQREIEESAYRFQRSLEVKETIVVGMNEFVDDEEAPRTDLLRVDPGLERDQVQRLRALRARRDVSAWTAALAGPRGRRARRDQRHASRSLTRSSPGPPLVRSRPACAGSSASIATPWCEFSRVLQPEAALRRNSFSGCVPRSSWPRSFCFPPPG